jgi:hypothetical protein
VSGSKAEIHPFDLQKRAALAARSLTRLLDERQDGLMYFLASWRAKPPRAVHGLWDYGDGSGRHIDALTLARRMLPADWPEAAPDRGEEALERWMLRQLGSDGLSWLPGGPGAAEPWGADLLMRDWRPGEAAAEISWAQRGTLLGLTTRFLATNDEGYAAAGRRLVDGLLRAAERDGQELVNFTRCTNGAARTCRRSSRKERENPPSIHSLQPSDKRTGSNDGTATAR